MSVYYRFYRPWDMKCISEGKFVGMPFYRNDLPAKPIQFLDNEGYGSIYYSCTGIMNREMAEKFQSVMDSNKTFFTDLMDKHGTDCLIYRII